VEVNWRILKIKHLLFVAMIAAGVFLRYHHILGKIYSNYLSFILLLIGAERVVTLILRFTGTKWKNKMQIVFFMLAIFCGLIGYSQQLGLKNFLNCIFYTAQLFTINAPIIDKAGQSNPSYFYPIWIELGRWFAVLFIASAVLSYIYKVTYDSYKLLKIRFSRKQHIVISGLNEATKLLALDLQEHEKQVVIITKDESHPDIDELREIGAAFVFGDALVDSVLTKAKVLQSSHFILMEENEANNIAVFMKLKHHLERKKIEREKPINCFILIKDDRYNPIFEEIQSEILDSDNLRENLEFNLFNLNTLKAKLLFDHHPLYKTDLLNIRNKAEKKKVHLVIVGFGNTGQQVLLQAAKLCHFINGEKLYVTVLDKYADERKSSFRRRYKKIDKVCDIKFRTVDVNSLEFSKDHIVDRNAPDITYISICLESDHLDFISGILLQEDYENIPIAIEVRDDIKLANWIHNNSGRFKNIFCFGDLKEIFSSKVIIDEELDNQAKAINDYYNKANDPKWFWNNLTVFLKESNRAQADHIKTKLHTMGLEMKQNPSPEDIVLNKLDYFEHLHHFINDLAIAEHNRWNAFHYINGWDKKDPAAGGGRKDEKLKLHKSLVPWAKLSENDQKNDRDTIESLYEILTANHFSICVQRQYLMEYCSPREIQRDNSTESETDSDVVSDTNADLVRNSRAVRERALTHHHRARHRNRSRYGN
jgi:hypothetical protein